MGTTDSNENVVSAENTSMQNASYEEKTLMQNVSSEEKTLMQNASSEEKTSTQNVPKEEIKDLVKKAKNNDPHSFALLYEMVYEDLYKMALYTLGNPQDAEDAVSDCVLDAFVGIKNLKDETAFRGWIFKILSFKCKRKISEYVSQRNTIADEPVDEMQDISSGAEKEYDTVINQEMLEKAFKHLEPDERLIVTMVVYGGLNSTEISRELGIKSNTVRSKYSRALAKLKQHLVL